MKFIILFIIGCSMAIPAEDLVLNVDLNQYAEIDYQGTLYLL